MISCQKFNEHFYLYEDPLSLDSVMIQVELANASDQLTLKIPLRFSTAHSVSVQECAVHSIIKIILLWHAGECEPKHVAASFLKW